jgi:hypothetical protein
MGLRRYQMTALKTTGSGLIAALEQTWAELRRRTSQLPEVVVVTGTGLSSGAVHIDAKKGPLDSLSRGLLHGPL